MSSKTRPNGDGVVAYPAPWAGQSLTHIVSILDRLLKIEAGSAVRRLPDKRLCKGKECDKSTR